MFVFPKDIRLAMITLVSLWILEELNFKSVLKKRTRQSVDYNLPSGAQMSRSNPLWAKSGSEWVPNTLDICIS